MAYKRISPQPVNEGGTGAVTLADHSVLIGSGTGAVSEVGPVASTGCVLQSNGVGSDPGFSTATYPSIATGTGTILRADGSNWVATTATYPATTTINQVLYSSAANTVTGITASNNGLLISSATGVPSWLAAGTTGQVLTATTGSPPSWGAAGGTGDVVGPGSATDNAITRFDGTTGKLIQNSTVTIDDTGNISDSNSAAGATLSMTLSNTSNTASSNALHQVTVAGTSAGDAFTTYTVSGTTNWSVGVDNSVTGDPFVIAASNALGTTNVMSITTAGEVTKPLQPAFFAYLGTGDTNKTGDGTSFTLGSGNALTESYDRGGDFVTTGTFTAPVTGIYQLGMNVQVSGLTSSHTLGYIAIITTAVSYVFNVANTWANNYANTNCLSGTVNAPMTAGDTATFTVVISGGTKVVGLTGSRGYTNVYGHLIC